MSVEWIAQCLTNIDIWNKKYILCNIKSIYGYYLKWIHFLFKKLNENIKIIFEKLTNVEIIQ